MFAVLVNRFERDRTLDQYWIGGREIDGADSDEDISHAVCAHWLILDAEARETESRRD